MKTVWKYSIPVADLVCIEVPKGGKPLCVQVQHETACVWILVDTYQPHVTRQFRVLGTGHDIHPDGAGDYIGSFQLAGGALVFHLFDLGELPAKAEPAKSEQPEPDTTIAELLDGLTIHD